MRTEGFVLFGLEVPTVHLSVGLQGRFRWQSWRENWMRSLLLVVKSYSR